MSVMVFVTGPGPGPRQARSVGWLAGQVPRTSRGRQEQALRWVQVGAEVAGGRRVQVARLT